MRVEWERDQRELNLRNDVARLQGTFDQLPALIEATARRVFQDMWQTAQQQASEAATARSNQTWRRADTVIAIGQMLIAAAVYLGLHH